MAVVGAGAAGIAAARALRQAGATVAVLEASGRIGGRAHTSTALSAPFDLGCTWLHSADVNPLSAEAARLGFDIRRNDPAGRVYLTDEERWAREGERESLAEFIGDAEDTFYSAGEDGFDVPLSDLAPEDPRWTPYLRWWVAAYTGAEIEDASSGDWALYRDTGVNWTLAEGYGALIARLGADLPVTLNAPVEEIAYAPEGVRVSGPFGAVDATGAILTVSTSILARELIRFEPGLSASKQEAINALPMGDANKIILGFRRHPFDSAEPHSVKTADAGYQIAPFRRRAASVYLGGTRSRELESLGEKAMIEFGLDGLKSIYGTYIERHFDRGIASRWRAETWIGGAYSAARPGRADERRILAEPIDDRLFFAGEASSKEGYHTTAHGAWITGERAAREALAAIGK